MEEGNLDEQTINAYDNKGYDTMPGTGYMGYAMEDKVPVKKGAPNGSLDMDSSLPKKTASNQVQPEVVSDSDSSDDGYETKM